MKAAYYGKEADSSELFCGLKISKVPSYTTHLNQYDVIKINMQEFLSTTHSVLEMLDRMSRFLIYDLTEHFTDIRYRDEGDLIQVMRDIFAKTGHSFVVLINEWDCLFREDQQDKEAQKIYSMYSPKSVVEAMLGGVFDNYWNQTETYEALKVYIQMNFDGLKDAVVRMLSGDSVEINIGTFSNDMTTFQGRDDVLTLLVHLGYLTYHWPDKTVSIPNREVAQEYVNAISTMDWADALKEYKGNLLLTGINYDRDSKKHSCVIEQYIKTE